VIRALEFHPLGDDEQFFAGSKYRKTRYRVVIPHCSLLGSPCLGLLQGKLHCGRTAQIEDAFLDVLINKDKRSAVDTAHRMTPNKRLSSILKIIQIDSLIVVNGRLKYGERYELGRKTALLSFDGIQMLANVPAHRNGRGDTVVIRARGKIMEAATASVVMSIPLASQEYTLQYSGSMNEMNLTALNPFLEPSEGKRFKTGILRSVEFDIHVVAGRASGNVRASYKDLKIIAIDGRTGSESGVGNTITSFITNNIKLRTTNLPDESGSMKIGKVEHEWKGSEAFLEFVWLALRSGIGDIVGF
jgi:hypothetical protein